MKVYAHTLFRNEERWLWYSVTSVIQHVDKLLLWDTGSTDKSWLIAKKLKEIYKEKIDLKQYGEVTSTTFYKARQEMLDQTNSDWFIIVDGDEVWWEDSVRNLLLAINKVDLKIDSIVVPTINVVGDIYHYLPANAGNYRFGDRIGHYNLRAVKRNVPGLYSKGLHGLWGWADENDRQIQDRNTFKFVNSPYLHTTFLPRGENRNDDIIVPKRSKKLKYEIGNTFPFDYYYPEVFFKNKPEFIKSPWKVMDNKYILKAIIQSPLKKIKRRFINARVGY